MQHSDRKNIPDPGFAGDDGSADPRLAEALARYGAARGASGRSDAAGSGAEAAAAEAAVLRALAEARLLVPIVAILGEAETDDNGLRREKSSDMAVPTIQAPDGRRGLPAFTSLAALRAWRADARPAPVPTRQAIEAAWNERADALLIDLAGPVFFELSGPALRVLGQGAVPGGALDDPRVAEAVGALLEREPAVLRAHLLPSRQADALLAVVPQRELPEPELGAAVRRLASGLAEDPVLRTRLLAGLDLALVPPDAPEPPTPFYARPS